MASNQQIYSIITKKLTGSINSDEQKTLDTWLSSEENRKEFAAYTKLWEKSKELSISKNIDIESSLRKTKKEISDFRQKKRWISLLQQAAAVLLLAFALSFLYQYFTNKPEVAKLPEQPIYQEVKAAFGTQTKLILADGTSVWLNSGSSLRFPSSFSNMDERNVELNGEGYFEVTKNEAKPFIVNTCALGVKVYGTSFNVSAYEGYNTETVALVEGKISMITNSNGKQKELLVLSPNEAAEYNRTTKKLYHDTEIYLDKYVGWKDGYIVFYDDPIKQVIQKLEKWYNVDIAINNKLLYKYRFTATFIDESLEQVLKLLSLSSPMTYKIIPAKKLPNNSFSKRKIVLTIKK